jgi:hypothetical protein
LALTNIDLAAAPYGDNGSRASRHELDAVAGISRPECAVASARRELPSWLGVAIFILCPYFSRLLVAAAAVRCGWPRNQHAVFLPK